MSDTATAKRDDERYYFNLCEHFKVAPRFRKASKSFTTTINYEHFEELKAKDSE